MALIKVEQSKQPLVIFVALVVIVISGILIFRTTHRPAPRANTTPFLALGPALAQEASQMLGGNGKVALVTYDLSPKGAGLMREQIKLFRAELAKNPGITLAAELQVILPPEALPEEVGLPADDYLRILREYSDVDAIVSFVGSPSLSDTQIRQLPRRIPKCIVFDTGNNRRVRKLLENRVIHAAIVARFDPLPPGAKKPNTMMEWFHAYYQIVTRETASSLPD